MFTNTEMVLLERSPAFACDYVYQMEIPEDSTSDILSELGSNLEYRYRKNQQFDTGFFIVMLKSVIWLKKEM
jgi:hypothetical protein